MGFLREFVENWIRNSMEDPEERDRIFRAHLYKTKALSVELKEAWAQPVKAFGLWNEDRSNHKLLMDLRLGRVSGRTDPVEQAAIAASSSRT